MTICALIADEVTAAGFRLAGVEVHVPEDWEVPDRFQQLLSRAQVLLVTAERAVHLPAMVLDQALADPQPLVLVIPDVGYRVEPPDVGARLRKQLGLAE